MIDNRYKTIQNLDQEYSSKLRLVEDTSEDNQPQVLKVYDTSEVERLVFLRNYSNQLEELSHPHLYNFYRFARGEEEGKDIYFSTSEYIEKKKTLKEFREEMGNDQKWSVFFQIAETLQYIHTQGFVHANLRLDNIDVIEKAGHFSVKLPVVDGLISENYPLSPNDSTQLEFCSPEQVQRMPLDRRSDIYSLGIICYFLFSGELPESVDFSIKASGDFADLENLEVSSLEKKMSRMLALDPKDRFRSIEELVKHFQETEPDTPFLPDDSPELPHYRGTGFLPNRADDIWETLQAKYSQISQSYSSYPLLLIKGEPGMGKSSLLESYSLYLETKGAKVRRARCSRGAGSPLYPFPALAQILQRKKREQADPKQDRWWKNLRLNLLWEEIHQFFIKLCQNKPSVILIDDLEYADELTLKVLEYMTLLPQGEAPLMFVATYNSNIVDQRFMDWLDRIHERPDSAPLELGPLSLEQIQDWLERKYQSVDVKSSFLDHLSEKSRGNLLSIKLIVDRLIAKEKVTLQDGTWVFPDGRDMDSSPIDLAFLQDIDEMMKQGEKKGGDKGTWVYPVRKADPLLHLVPFQKSRIQELPDHVIPFCQRLAMAYEPIPWVDLKNWFGGSEDQLLEQLQPLVEYNLFQISSTGHFWLNSNLFTLLRKLEVEENQLQYAQEWLAFLKTKGEQISPISLAVYAYYAQKYDFFLEVVEKAVAPAENLGCFNLAGNLYQWALESLPKDDEKKRVELAQKYSRLHEKTKNFWGIIDCYRDYIEEAEQTREDEVRNLVRLAKARMEVRKVEMAQECLQEAMDKVKDLNSPELDVQVHSLHSILQYELGDIKGAVMGLEEARKSSPHQEEQLYLQHYQAELLINFGEYQRAQQMLTNIEEAAKEVGSTFLRAIVSLMRSRIATEQADYSEAIEHVQSAESVFMALGDIRHHGAALMNMAQIWLTQQEYEKALAPAREAYHLCLALEDKGYLWKSQRILGEILLAKDEETKKEGRTHLLKAMFIANQGRDPVGLCELLMDLSKIHIERKDAGRAEILTRKAREMSKEKNMPYLTARVDFLSGIVARLLEQEDIETALIDRALETFRKLGNKKEVCEVHLDRLQQAKKKGQDLNKDLLGKLKNSLEKLDIARFNQTYEELVSQS